MKIRDIIEQIQINDATLVLEKERYIIYGDVHGFPNCPDDVAEREIKSMYIKDNSIIVFNVK